MPQFSSVKSSRLNSSLKDRYRPQYFNLQGRIFCRHLKEDAASGTQDGHDIPVKIYGNIERSFQVRFYHAPIDGESTGGFGGDIHLLLGANVLGTLNVPRNVWKRVECTVCVHGWGDGRRGHFLPISLPTDFRPLSLADSNVIHIPYLLMQRNFRLDEADFSGSRAMLFRSDQAQKCVELDDLHRWLHG